MMIFSFNNLHLMTYHTVLIIQLVVRTAEGLAGQETHHIILIQICLADIISIFLIVDVIHTAFAVSASAFGCMFSHLSFQNKKESCLQDSPPAAGRFSDTLPLRRSAILSGAFFVS